MKKGKEIECNPIPAYLSEDTPQTGIKMITTELGRLVLPELNDRAITGLIADGWHPLEKEYYGCDRVDILVADVAHKSIFIVSNRHRTFKGDNWWLPNCGDLMTPYEWSNDMAVIAWRPVQKEAIK
jgi:hypothetical protein